MILHKPNAIQSTRRSTVNYSTWRISLTLLLSLLTPDDYTKAIYGIVGATSMCVYIMCVLSLVSGLGLFWSSIEPNNIPLITSFRFYVSRRKVQQQVPLYGLVVVGSYIKLTKSMFLTLSTSSHHQFTTAVKLALFLPQAFVSIYFFRSPIIDKNDELIAFVASWIISFSSIPNWNSSIIAK